MNYDEFVKPLILQGGLCEETVYRNCLTYAKIVCGNEEPWCSLSMDIRRANLHSRIAEDCDCDRDLVEDSFERVFSNLRHSEMDFYRRPIDDDFLKLVDRWFGLLKKIADSPRSERFPSLIPDGPIEVSGIPNTEMNYRHPKEGLKMTDFERTMVDRYFGDAPKNLAMRETDWVAMWRMLSWETWADAVLGDVQRPSRRLHQKEGT